MSTLTHTCTKFLLHVKKAPSMPKKCLIPALYLQPLTPVRARLGRATNLSTELQCSVLFHLVQ